MSTPVPLERLRAALDERPPVAYLLTVSDDARPHAVETRVAWEGARLVADVGTRSAGNATARPSVSLLYATRHEGDYSLIVDGTAEVAPHGETWRVSIAPTKAVLHRPAAVPTPGSPCADDCVPLLRTTR